MFQSNNSHAKSVEYLYLDEIRRDGGTQPRAAINLQHVKLLEEQMEDGQQLEPVTVFYDGESYWLADGFHRWHAHKNQEEDVIACIIHQGSRRDAVLFSVGANTENKPALPRSRQDKHRAVLTLLQDREWGTWSDREIAKQCKVSQPFVSRLKNNLTDNVISEKAKRTYKTKHGTIAKMNTTNIGKKTPTPGETKRVTIKPDHPLFGGQSGTITQHPNSDAVIVELDTGKEELVYLKDLTMDIPNNKEHPNIAHHLKLNKGGLVEIRVPNNSKINGRQGRIASVRDNTVEVWVRDVERMMMHLYSLKHQQVEPVPMDTEPQLLEVESRIAKLRQCSLDPFEVEILLLLERPVAFTPTEMEYLTQMEQRHNNS
ncbi:MAG: ParB N-terminal domain-containing protein [Scytonema sp. PMC 1069.18]|nr:ParB N-terminal domain-containing protein [Scytonema sp. PMC 1069.18]MEC4888180.1 ParB N-terminal domain-containing protein [Scytonema sp. PMC 1070.18]